MTSSTIVRPADPTLRQALRLSFYFAAIKLAFQFALTLNTQHLGYGYFRDEFYYIACGRHLAWGYVDHGPIVAVQARLGEILFGDSLFAIRIFSAVAGAVMVFLAGLVTWSLGGRKPAQVLAMLGLILCPQFIGLDGYLSMNSFEPIFWTTCLLAATRMLRGGSERFWWFVFGLSAGVGLLNKPSMTFFLLAFGFALLVTPQRKLLFTRWAAMGIALLVLIALPNLLWQVHNHWPTLEFLQNGRIEHKTVVLNPLQFLLAQFANMQPINVLLWMTGVVALLRGKSIRNTRWLGLTYVFFFVLMFALHAKDYYLAPIYPAFFAAGAVAWEHRFAASRGVARQRTFAFPIFEAMLLITTALILPMASPILRPYTWLRYTAAMHLHATKSETGDTALLPQFYADRFGWQELTDQVVTIYQTLPPEEQAKVCIWADNYGEAGAIDFLGPRAQPGLPKSLSGDNNYWIWGTHGCTFDVVIGVTQATLAEMQERYESVEVVGKMTNPLAVTEEHRTIYLLRHRKPSMPVVWVEWKNYI